MRRLEGWSGTAVTQFISMGVCGLRIAPQFEELAAHVRMESLRECLWEPKRPDRLQHVGEVLQAVGCGHPGGELQFEQFQNVT